MKNSYVNALNIGLFVLFLVGVTTNSFGQDCSTCPVGVTCVGDPPPQTYFNTGSNAAGTGVLPIYSNDLHWTVAQGSISGTYSPAKVITPNSAYYSSPFPNATWIAHNNDGSHTGNADFYYKIEFYLPCMNNCGVDFSVDGNYCVTLDYFADNSVTAAYVNGVQKTLTGAAIPDPYTYQGYLLAGRRTGTLCSGWKPGLNTLIVKVSSGQPYQGFLAQMSTSVVAPPVPVVNPTVNLTQICAGQAATFSANAQNGGFSPSFQWQVNGTNVSGATSSTFTSSSLQNGDVVKVIMTPTPGCGNVTQAQMTVNVLPVVNTNVVINPANPEICAGNTINFTTTATYGSGVTPSYTWFKNGVNVGTGSSYNGSGLLDGDEIVVRMISSYPCEVVSTVYDTVKVKVNANPSVSVASSNITNACSIGGSDGAALVTGSSGTGSYTYSLNGGSFQSSSSFTGLAAGNYTVTIRDTKGCTGQTNFSITQPTANLSASVTSSNITNNCTVGAANGSAQVTASGGYGSLTYSLNGGTPQTSNSFTGLTTGSYTVTVTDANNCSATAGFTIQNPSGELSASVNASNIVNNCTIGGAAGSVQVSATGGFGTYRYSLNGGAPQTSNSFTGLLAGGYTVTVTDANNCSETVSFSIQDPAQVLAASVAAADIVNNCTVGASNGSAQVTASGGYGSLTYSLNGGAPQSSNSFTGLTANNYTVTVTDANNCTTTTTFTIQDPVQVLTASVAAANIVNNCTVGASNGSAQVTASGGYGSLTYSLNGGTPQTSNSFTGLTTGSYTVTVTDANNCSVTATFSIQAPSSALTASVSAADIVNNCTIGGTSGSVQVAAAGGFGAYRYSLNGGSPQTSNSFTGLLAGGYTVTVTDANNCTETVSFSIQDPAQVLAVSVAAADVVNNCTVGASNGSAQVTASGGYGSLTYSLNGGAPQSSNSFTGLTANNYTVTVTDANNCTTTTTFTIQDPAQVLTASVAAADIVNNCTVGASNGSAQVTASGGYGSLTYSLNGGTPQTSNSFTGLTTGSYTVTVTDANNCSATAGFTIQNPSGELSASVNASNIVNNCTIGGAAGSVQVSATGGFGTYRYSLNGGAPQTSNSFTGLLAGGYTVTVTDANNCSEAVSFSIQDPAQVLAASVAAADIVNNCTVGASNGSAQVTASGGYGSLTYSLNGGAPQSSNAFTGLIGGNYTVEVRDANGCTATTTFVITDANQNLTASITQGNMIHNCNIGASTGSVQITTNGGFAPYLYTLNGGPAQSSNAYIGLTAGNYTVVITDANACSTQLNFTIQDPAQNLSASVTANNITQNCVAGASNGSALISVVGGFSPFSFALNGGLPQVSSSFTGLAAGSYTVTVRDSNGCATQTTFTIQDPAQPLSASVAPQHITHVCAGTPNGSAQITANGGFAPYSYVVNGGTAQSSNMFTNLGAGSYNAVVTDDNGCTATTSFTILTPAQSLTVSVALDSIVNNCQIGAATGTAHISAAGGFGLLSYSINGGTLQTSNVFQNLPAGNYTVSVRDTNGCTAQTTFTILDPVNGAIDIQANLTHVSCNGDNDGTIDAQITGGFAPYVFSWSHNAALNQEDAANLAPGNYTLSVVDDNGCTDQMTWTITEPAVLTSTITQVVDVLCFGDATGAITVAPVGGTAPYSFTWNSNPPQTNAIATQLEAGMYGVTIVDANGCITNNMATIQQPTLLTISANSNVNAACYGTAVELFSQASGGTPDYHYTWTNGATTSNQTINVTQSGTYAVSVTDANGCTASVAVPLNITLYPTPMASFTYNPQIITEKNPEVYFVNQSQNASYYIWNFGNGQSSGEENPVHLYAPEENEYNVQLVATNVYGCSDSAFAKLTVIPDFALYIPNAFTPNGDKLNPRFLLVGKGYSSCTMSIFDRWGMELIRLEDDQPFVMGWDGTYKDEECPIGVYVYKLEIFDMRNQRYVYTGHINLLR